MTTDLRPLIAEAVRRIEAQTVKCFVDGYHWLDEPAMPDCPDCHGTGHKPNPTYAPLLAALTERCPKLGQSIHDSDWSPKPCSDCHIWAVVRVSISGTGRRVRDVSGWPKGALKGAIEYGVKQVGWAFEDAYEASYPAAWAITPEWADCDEAALRALLAALPEVKSDAPS